VHVIGDAHVYLNHVEPLREQLERKPRPFPTLTIKESKDAGSGEIDTYSMDDLEMKGYHPYPTIKMEMAV